MSGRGGGALLLYVDVGDGNDGVEFFFNVMDGVIGRNVFYLFSKGMEGFLSLII